MWRIGSRNSMVALTFPPRHSSRPHHAPAAPDARFAATRGAPRHRPRRRVHASQSLWSRPRSCARPAGLRSSDSWHAARCRCATCVRRPGIRRGCLATATASVRRSTGRVPRSEADAHRRDPCRPAPVAPSSPERIAISRVFFSRSIQGRSAMFSMRCGAARPRAVRIGVYFGTMITISVVMSLFSLCHSSIFSLVLTATWRLDMISDIPAPFLPL